MRAETVEALREYAVEKRRHDQRASFATDLEAERGAGPTADPATSGAPVEKALARSSPGGPRRRLRRLRSLSRRRRTAGRIRLIVP